MNEMKLYLGEVFYFTDSPLLSAENIVYEPDGALCVCDGLIVEAGTSAILLQKYPKAEVVDYQGSVLMPGFIDAHLHYVQTEITGMYGRQLLDWLNQYTFPAERAFANTEHCHEISRAFLKELFRNGTTTAVAFSSVHPQSADILFEEASRYNMCMLTGKVQMDQEAPEYLCDTPEQGEAYVRVLIQKWHGKGRNKYVITPRFAVSCSPAELEACQRIHADYPDTYIQTHLSENKGEVDFVKTLYPDCSDYLSVYEKYGLLTDRTLLAHAIHLSDSERKRIAKAQAIAVHCPTSNGFLGSGLYEMEKANEAGMQTVIGTDIGGGTSFSIFHTLGASYQVQQLNNYPMSAFEAFYKATLGSAKSLHLDQEIGSFLPGRMADFIVVDYSSTFAQLYRYEYLKRTKAWNIENLLFGLMTHADDRAVRATYIAGQCVHER